MLTTMYFKTKLKYLNNFNVVFPKFLLPKSSLYVKQIIFMQFLIFEYSFLISNQLFYTKNCLQK